MRGDVEERGRLGKRRRREKRRPPGSPAPRGAQSGEGGGYLSHTGLPRLTDEGLVTAPIVAPAPAPIAAPANGAPTMAPTTAPVAAPMPAPERPRSPVLVPHPASARAATRSGILAKVFILTIHGGCGRRPEPTRRSKPRQA